MSVIRLHPTTTATPEQSLAGLTDYGPGRAQLFCNSADDYLDADSMGGTDADATEGSAGVRDSDRGQGPARVSEDLERWLRSDGDKTLGGLIDVFEEKSFALLFVVLLGIPALPLPTGGATHVFEVIAIVLALQMVAGRKTIWLPRRWCRLELAGPKRERFLNGLLKMIRRLERISRPRLAFLFGHRTSNAVLGLLVTGLSAAAFVAPPFSGLDTLPALGAVLLSLGVLLEDAAVAALGILIGLVGIAVEVALGGAVARGIGSLF